MRAGVVLLCIGAPHVVGAPPRIYRQCDPRWASDVMGVPGRPQTTLCRDGAALTSLAMALDGAGYVMPESGAAIDPRALNKWLVGNGGYRCRGAGCADLVPGALDVLTGGRARVVGEWPVSALSNTHSRIVDAHRRRTSAAREQLRRAAGDALETGKVRDADVLRQRAADVPLHAVGVAPIGPRGDDALGGPSEHCDDSVAFGSQRRVPQERQPERAAARPAGPLGGVPDVERVGHAGRWLVAEQRHVHQVPRGQLFRARVAQDREAECRPALGYVQPENGPVARVRRGSAARATAASRAVDSGHRCGQLRAARALAVQARRVVVFAPVRPGSAQSVATAAARLVEAAQAPGVGTPEHRTGPGRARESAAHRRLLLPRRAGARDGDFGRLNAEV